MKRNGSPIFRTVRHVPFSAAILLFGALMVLGDEPPGKRAAPPNIVLILADDLGYGELSVMGQERFATPAIDQLAEEGVLFTHHYAGSAVCAPSRSALMTGLHTGHTQVRNNFGVDLETGENVRVGLRPEDLTVAELLHEAGYRTGLIGKWGLGEAGTGGEPLTKGFDTFFGFLNQARAHDHYPEWIWDQGERLFLEGNANGGEGAYVHDLFTERAMQFIAGAKKDSRPFFLYLAYTLPHSELKVPHEGTDAPETPNEVFSAMVQRLDRDVGRLAAQLDELGLAENTVLLFTSDNGPHEQEGKSNAYFEAAGPYRGIKRDVYEGGIRVPLIVRWPGRVVPGSVSTHVSAFWDFLPTAADIAGIPAPDSIDGISYLPAMLGLPNPVHEYLYWEYVTKGETRRAVRIGDWKAVIQGDDQKLELYHLPSDPGEQTDVSHKWPRIVARIHKVLFEAHRPNLHYPLIID